MDSTIPFEELERGELLGKGMFGAVYKGKWKEQVIAIKQIFTSNSDYDVDFYFSREVDILSSIVHPNIVKFYGISKDDTDLYIITEFIDGPNLRDALKENLGWEERINIAIQIAQSISYLHQHKIIHRDVKTENVLIEKDTLNVKLCDFGFSRPSSNDEQASKHKTFVGSEWFEAPEIMFCMDYDERIDIFSYGVVLCELISRQKPSMSVFKREIPGFGISSSEIRSRANEGAPKELIDLTIACCEPDPDKRLFFETILRRLEDLKNSFTKVGESEKEKEEKEKEKEEKQDKHKHLQIDITDFPEVQLSPSSPVTINSPKSFSPRNSQNYNNQAKTNGDLEEIPPLGVLDQPNYSGASILAIGRLQLQVVDAPATSPMKGIIPQKDQVAWRNFLVQFRSSIRVRDIQKAGGTIRKIRTFRNCFTGSEGVDWIARETKLDRLDALELAKILIRLNVIREATPTGTTGGSNVIYKDTNVELYRFSDDGIFFRRERAPSFLKRFSQT